MTPVHFCALNQMLLRYDWFLSCLVHYRIFLMAMEKVNGIKWVVAVAANQKKKNQKRKIKENRYYMFYR